MLVMVIHLLSEGNTSFAFCKGDGTYIEDRSMGDIDRKMRTSLEVTSYDESQSMNGMHYHEPESASRECLHLTSGKNTYSLKLRWWGEDVVQSLPLISPWRTLENFHNFQIVYVKENIILKSTLAAASQEALLKWLIASEEKLLFDNQEICTNFLLAGFTW